MIVLASATVVAGGYIINNFYDSEKDLINRPNKSMLDRLVSQNTKLSFYFVLNFFAIIIASYVDFKAVLFFSAYIFGIWFYSHKLKKVLIIGNAVSAFLTIAPFFVIFVYYKNFDNVIFVHGMFLFLVIAIRELTKDLENIKGDLALNYQTIPIEYGEKVSKKMITFLVALTIVLVALTIVPAYLLVMRYKIGHMDKYFFLCVALLVIFLVFLWSAKTKQQYLLLHNILKFIIVAGVFSILLIDIDLVLKRIL